ncbi:MAG: hypothetical protein U0T84_13150 [Chitinophagales bacterium]
MTLFNQYSVWEMALFLISTFNAILFLQSGLDKVFDYSSNRSWLEGHFANSILRGTVGILLPVITLLELLAGCTSAAAAILEITGGHQRVMATSLTLCSLSLLALFFGQRVAKDYAGAFTLAGYFAVELLGFLLLLRG